LPPPKIEKNGKEKEKNRYVERSRSKTEKKRNKNRSVKEKLKLKQTVCCDFVVFAGHGITTGREGQKRRSVFRSQCFLGCLRRLVAVACGEDAPQCFCDPEAFRHCSRSFL
jgi:hypothetical protein